MKIHSLVSEENAGNRVLELVSIDAGPKCRTWVKGQGFSAQHRVQVPEPGVWIWVVGCRYQSCTDVVGLASVPSSGCEKELEPSLRTFNARSRSRLGPDCGSTGGFMSTELQLHKVLVLDQRSEEPGSRCGLG